MSDLIYPALPGLAFSVKKTPEYKTVVNTSVSGVESRIGQWSAPRWHFELVYDLLRDDATNELKSLAGFFLSRQGQYDDFLFFDPDDHAAVNQGVGIGDGVTTAFQLVRVYGGFVEPVRGLLAAPVLRVGGVAVTAFSWTTRGVVTFAAAPAAGALISADFSFYFRVRFETDSQDFEKFAAGLWEAKSVKLVSVK